jgi:hypothetical protein
MQCTGHTGLVLRLCSENLNCIVLLAVTSHRYMSLTLHRGGGEKSMESFPGGSTTIITNCYHTDFYCLSDPLESA